MNLLVVLDIDGSQGISVANAFLHLPNWRVRGLTRSPSSHSSHAWWALGVEIVYFDVTKNASLEECFADATAIFAVTDYNIFLNDPGVQRADEITGEKLELVAAKRERDIGSAIVDAATRVGRLSQFVMSMVSDMASKPPGMSSEYQIAVKQIVQLHLEDIGSLLAKRRYQEVCFRMEDYRGLLVQKNDGTLRFGTCAPGCVSLPWINMATHFGVIAQALVVNVPAVQSLVTMIEWLNGHEICTLIRKVSGIACNYHQWTPKEMKELKSFPVSDFPGHDREYEYWEPFLEDSHHRASLYNLDFPKTTFEGFLEVDLPKTLEMVMGQTPSGMSTVFKAVSHISEHEALGEALATSTVMASSGFQKCPIVNARNHDRSEFIGNHPMTERKMTTKRTKRLKKQKCG